MGIDHIKNAPPPPKPQAPPPVSPHRGAVGQPSGPVTRTHKGAK